MTNAGVWHEGGPRRGKKPNPPKNQPAPEEERPGSLAMALLPPYPRQQESLKYDANIISNGYASGGLSSPLQTRLSSSPPFQDEGGKIRGLKLKPCSKRARPRLPPMREEVWQKGRRRQGIGFSRLQPRAPAPSAAAARSAALLRLTALLPPIPAFASTRAERGEPAQCQGGGDRSDGAGDGGNGGRP